MLVEILKEVFSAEIKIVREEQSTADIRSYQNGPVTHVDTLFCTIRLSYLRQSSYQLNPGVGYPADPI